MSQNDSSLKTVLMLSTAVVVCVGAYLFFTNKTNDAEDTAPVQSTQAPKTDAAPEKAAEKQATTTSETLREQSEEKASATITQSPEDKITAPESATPVESKTATPETATQEKADKGIAAVFPDKTTISVAEVDAAINQAPESLLQQVPLPKLYRLMLTRLVNNKLIKDAALKAGLENDSEFVQKFNDIKEREVQKYILEKATGQFMTEAALKEKYQELLPVIKNEQEIEVSHILFKDQQEATKVLAELTKSKANIEQKFKAAVTKHSVDPSSKSKGGYIGWIPKAKLKGFQELAAAQPGDIVNAVLPVFEQGYSVFFVKAVRPMTPPSFEQARPDLERIFKAPFIIQALDQMRKDAGLTLTGLDNEPLPLPEMPKMPPLGSDPSQVPPMPKPKDFSHVDDKSLKDDMVVGTLKNGDKITLGEVRETFRKIQSDPAIPAEQKQDKSLNQIYEPVLLRVADMKILEKKAQEGNVLTAEDFKKQLDESKMMLIQNVYLQKEIQGRITQKTLKDLYEEVSPQLNKDDMEVSIRHILVKTKEEAEKLIQEIKAGGTPKFDEYVTEHSLDESTKARKGDIGAYLPKSRLAPEIASALFKAPKATLVPEPVKLTDQGYSIVRVEDKRTVKPPTFEQLVPELTDEAQKIEKAKVIKNMIENSKVTLYDMKGNVIPLASLLSGAEPTA